MSHHKTLCIKIKLYVNNTCDEHAKIVCAIFFSLILHNSLSEYYSSPLMKLDIIALLETIHRFIYIYNDDRIGYYLKFPRIVAYRHQHSGRCQ